MAEVRCLADPYQLAPFKMALETESAESEGAAESEVAPQSDEAPMTVAPLTDLAAQQRLFRDEVLAAEKRLTDVAAVQRLFPEQVVAAEKRLSAEASMVHSKETAGRYPALLYGQ